MKLSIEQQNNDKRLAEILSLSKNFKVKHKECKRCGNCLTTNGHICVPIADYSRVTKKHKSAARRRGLN
jgi:hypothetical protein